MHRRTGVLAFAAGLLLLLSLLHAAGRFGTLAQAPEIAFTWDDLPAHSALPPAETREQIASRIISAMKEAGMPPAFGFVNGVQMENEPLSAAVLREWRNAGLPLGNHTWSHMNLNHSSLADWEADVLRDEPILQSSMGSEDWRWLRFPYLAEGDTPDKRAAARKFLAGRGYKIAGVTMSFGDYMFNEPYARCVARNDSAAIGTLEASYLEAARANIDYTRAMSLALYGHDIPYVLLMHVGALDARLLPRLLRLYRERGFRFVRLQDAEQNAFYRNDLDLSLAPVPDTLEEALRERNLPIPEPARSEVDLNSICR